MVNYKTRQELRIFLEGPFLNKYHNKKKCLKKNLQENIMLANKFEGLFLHYAKVKKSRR